MRDDFDWRLRDYYQRQRLSQPSMARLLAQARHARKPIRTGWLKTWPRLVFASTFLVIFSFSLVHFSDESSVDALMASVAREVALNHDKALALEFLAQDYEVLNTYMDKLDFRLRHPLRLAASDLTLRGARYCSIQGQLAAQLTFRNAAGQRFTLYQTKSSEVLARLVAGSNRVDGIDVERWQEGDAFYALAYDVSNETPTSMPPEP